MQLPSAPTQGEVRLRGNYEEAAGDYTVGQHWERYTPADHALWRELWGRQARLIATHAAPEFVAGVRLLDQAEDGIPHFEAASAVLRRRTGWEIVAVPGLIPERDFFGHLAARRFPVTVWLRRPDEIDYLVEPDVFHDFYGHVPLLTQPAFADFVQAYGRLGAAAEQAGALPMLARLYWYMVEFGLLRTREGLRAYGAGILSSAGETRHCLESPDPNRIGFDLERVLRTGYLIDAFQRSYFVIDSFEQLFEAVRDGDFATLFRRWRDVPALPPETLLPGDRVITAGRLARRLDH